MRFSRLEFTVSAVGWGAFTNPNNRGPQYPRTQTRNELSPPRLRFPPRSLMSEFRKAHQFVVFRVHTPPELAREIGVASIPVSAFYANGEDNHVLRFCFAKSEETLARAAERLCAL